MADIQTLAKETAEAKYLAYAENAEDVNAKDDHDFTALHWACRLSTLAVVQKLVERGANVSLQNCGGDTPLHYAVSRGDREMIRLLLEKGASVTQPNDHGNTPLHYAAFWRQEDVCQLLVEAGAVVMAMNKHNRTPLDRAGPALADKIKGWARNAGQKLNLVQVETRSLDDVNIASKAKILQKAAAAGISWEVNPRAMMWGEMLRPNPRFGLLADIYAGEWNGFTIAIKKLREQNLNRDELAELRAEIDKARKAIHKNILPVLGACLQPPSIAVFYELSPHGNLSWALHDAGFEMDRTLAINLAKEVCRGMAYLHTCPDVPGGITHRNLKSSNIILDANRMARISEYGLGNSVFNLNTRKTTVILDPAWIAPEVLQKTDVDNYKAADVYSFGILLFEIFTRQFPYETTRPMHLGLKVLLEGLRPEIPEYIPSHFGQLMQLCWQEGPDKRPTFEQLVGVLDYC